jgi:hypothetical protein
MHDSPYIYDSGDFPPDELAKGMMLEMASMRRFDVFTEAPASSLPPDAVRTAITTRWVHRWKGDVVRSRLVCRGFNETVTDEDQTYASTPLVVMVKLLVLISLSLSWHIEFWDVGAALLHATVTGELYVVHHKSSILQALSCGDLARHCMDFVRRPVPGKTNWQNSCIHTTSNVCNLRPMFTSTWLSKSSYSSMLMA